MKRKIVKRICVQCGKEFEDYEQRKRRFCSLKCYQDSRPKKIFVKCANCQKLYKTYAKPGIRYCSKKCMYSDKNWILKQKKQTHTLAQKEIFSKKNVLNKTWVGENNPNYKHGLYALRSSIKKQANGICSICKKGIKNIPDFLDLHHKNGNHHDNRKENMIAICPNCHKKEHMKRLKERNKYLSQYNEIYNI